MEYAVWGSELSPFTLKLQAQLRYAGIPFIDLPRNGGRLQNLRISLLIERAKRKRTAMRYPRLDPLDEYPLVPFLIEDGKGVLYDSSALARWIDARFPPASGSLFPVEPASCFIAQLIDEAFDEFGLYMAHHNRWVMSAKTNDAGVRLAREYRRLLPPGLQGAFARYFSRRQVRRLPYLFSVAPEGFAVPGLIRNLTPPSRPGFRPTHALLDQAWEAYVAAMEHMLTRQPFLLGDRFTVADASAYGQLAMNLADPTTAQRLRELAPTTFAWVTRMYSGDVPRDRGTIRLTPDLRPLLAIIQQTFVPLMQQNETAYETFCRSGEARFNERAFNAGVSLYDGMLLGQPFRSVAKTFQVRVWRDLKRSWAQLPSSARSDVAELLGDTDCFQATARGA
jgi:glutathione S-transferase